MLVVSTQTNPTYAADIYASSSSVLAGSSTSIKWTSTNMTSCTVTKSYLATSTEFSATSTFSSPEWEPTDQLLATTTYTLVCNKNGGGTQSASTTVRVGATPYAHITANNPLYDATSTINLFSSNVSTCTTIIATSSGSRILPGNILNTFLNPIKVRISTTTTITNNVKTASKGVRLTGPQIFDLARGGVIDWENDAPTFSLNQSPRFVHRKIQSR